MEKHNDPEKTTPALFLSKGVHKITTKIQDHGLEKLAGELWEKPPATGTRHVLPAQLSRACPAIAQSSEGQRLALLISQRHFTLVNWHSW